MNKKDNKDFNHAIGMIMTDGTFFPNQPISTSAIRLAQGSTSAFIDDSAVGNYLDARIVIAGGATSNVAVDYNQDLSEREQNIILHNPMIAFWRRAVLYFENREKLVRDDEYLLRFEDFALIISDLGQSLYMLFGRHWNDEAKKNYGQKVGTPPQETPDLLALLEKYYPPIGWDLPGTNAELWWSLRSFIYDYYQDIVKHFEYEKFKKALSLTFDTLARFMEITRKTWIWFMEKYFNLTFDPNSEAFKDFAKEFCELR